MLRGLRLSISVIAFGLLLLCGALAPPHRIDWLGTFGQETRRIPIRPVPGVRDANDEVCVGGIEPRVTQLRTQYMRAVMPGVAYSSCSSVGTTCLEIARAIRTTSLKWTRRWVGYLRLFQQRRM